MKIELEPQGIEAIAQKIVELLKPYLTGRTTSEEDAIMTKKEVAEYLKVSVSTIDKLVSNKQIPYFKVQEGRSSCVRFSKKQIDRWIQKHTIPDIYPFALKR